MPGAPLPAGEPDDQHRPQAKRLRALGCRGLGRRRARMAQRCHPRRAHTRGGWLVLHHGLLGRLCLCRQRHHRSPARQVRCWHTKFLVTDKSRRPARFITTPSLRFVRRMVCWPARSQAGKRRVHPGHDLLMRDAWPGALALRHGDACQGLMTFTPAASKGRMSRVATAKPLARATAAMRASAVSTAKPAARDLASSSA